MSNRLTKPFILILVLLVLVCCYFVFKPFLTEIIVAAILTTVFYKPFNALTKFLGGRKNLAAVLMCLLLVILIIIPSVKLLVYAGEKSVEAYSSSVEFFNNHEAGDILKTSFFQQGSFKNLNLGGLDLRNENFQAVVLSTLKQSSDWLISGATNILMETTNFLVSLVLIILTMFFFFVDGKKMLEWLMYLSPLPDNYDQEIFKKFRAVSYSTMVSTFVACLAQGVVGAIGFAIVGFPAFLAGVVIALLSLLPYIGSMIFYVPVGIYYLLIGSIWQGIFILAWGAIVIGSTDNIIRAYMIKDKAEVNPIFVLFSVLGGVVLFGFWGVVLGPLVVALTVTVFHIYEIEFCGILSNGECGEKKLLAKQSKK